VLPYKYVFLHGKIPYDVTFFNKVKQKLIAMHEIA